MGTDRMEAFSDGVIAIIITVMVLELKIPQQTTLRALTPVVPVLLTYLLSFIYLGIYWNNHHHLLHTVDRVSGGMLWANLHLRSGSRSSRSPPAGWASITSHPCRPRSTAWCC